MGDLIEFKSFKNQEVTEKSERDYLKEMIDNLNTLIAKFESDYPSSATQEKK